MYTTWHCNSIKAPVTGGHIECAVSVTGEIFWYCDLRGGIGMMRRV